MKIRIGTYNCENLFVFHRLREKGFDLRFKTTHHVADMEYDGKGVRITALKRGWAITKNQRQITARSILENQPDMIALQEIENLDALRAFVTDFMNFKIKDIRGVSNSSSKIYWKMPYVILIDGNDDGFIDVALMSRFPIIAVRTHIWDTRKTAGGKTTPVFPRDCLEVDVEIPTKPKKKIVTFYVNHFTSKRSDKTGDKREIQAEEVIKIVKKRFGDKIDKSYFVILGDLNAAPEEKALKTTLYNSAKIHLINPLSLLPANQQWTHFWYNDDPAKPDPGKLKSLSQLDHLLLSRAFKTKNPSPKVLIERRGLLRTIEDVKENKRGPLLPKFPGVTKELGTEGSDHCPVFVDLEI